MASSMTSPGVCRRKQVPWRESVIALAILITAWIYGYVTTQPVIAPLVPNVLPGAQTVEADGDIYTAYDAAGQVIGYAAAADAVGYGGPVYLLVGVDPQGEIAGIQVIEQRETPGFYRLLSDNDFVQQFLGRTPEAPFVFGEDIDGVSGASLSAHAVAAAIWQAVEKTHVETHTDATVPIQFGLPEITLLALFAGNLLLPRLHDKRRKKVLRWAMLLVSLVVLGFMLNEPLTLANIASLLAGYWPAWQTHLYWYLMFIGVFGFIAVSGKNVYCYSMCPFAAVQECFGVMGAAKAYRGAGIYHRLRWVPRWLAVLALAMGLAFRQPGAASYEPFGTLFAFSAGFFPWMLLVVVLFTSMVILRPFCYYLCPVKAVLDFLLFIRSQARQVWKTNAT